MIKDYEDEHGSNFGSFAYWLLKCSDEIKITSSGRNEVRMMTVHASKGLEAPFVILADANVIDQKINKWCFCEDTFLYIEHKEGGIAQQILNNQKEKNYEEYYRLMYVAMTRAKDALIVTGAESRYKDGKSWYNCIKNGLQSLTHDNFDKEIVLHYGDQFDTLYSEKIEEKDVCTTDQKYELKAFDYSRPVIYPKLIQIDSIDEIKGNVFHGAVKLLNDTKDLSFAESFIRLSNVLQRTDKDFLIQKVRDIYEKFDWMFGVNSRSEVAFCCTDNGVKKEGRMDLVINGEDVVQIIDFKLYTNEELNFEIMQQMRFYYNFMRKMTTKRIEVYLFWVNSMSIEKVPINNQ